MIPLRPDRQDKARFSHKIGEYLSSGRPIVTGRVGEISHYFEHRKNAFIADDYTPEAYATLLSMIANDRDLANEVGRAGRELGENSFGYQQHGQKIAAFFSNL